MNDASHKGHSQNNEANMWNIKRRSHIRHPWCDYIINDQIRFEGFKDIGEARPGHGESFNEGGYEMWWKIFGCLVLMRKLRSGW